jgi:hypothetical protein
VPNLGPSCLLHRGQFNHLVELSIALVKL